MLKKIGFVNPTEVRTVGNFVADGVEDYLSMVLVGTPLGHSLSEETEEVQKAVRESER